MMKNSRKCVWGVDCPVMDPPLWIHEQSSLKSHDSTWHNSSITIVATINQSIIMASTLWCLLSHRNPHWEDIRARIGTHPSEVTCNVKKTLHTAVGHTHIPPSDVISSLLNTKSKSKLKESEKLEILTEACYNPNMNGDVVWVLLEAFELKPSMEFVYRLSKDILSYGNEDDHGNDGEQQGKDYDYEASEDIGVLSKSFSTITAIITFWPHVLSIKDKNENILLHHACGKGKIPIETIEIMLRISVQHRLHYFYSEANDVYEYYNHGGLMTMNRHKRTPIQNLCRLINEIDNENALNKVILCNKLCPELPILHAGVHSITKANYLEQLIQIMVYKTTAHHDNQCIENINLLLTKKDEYNRTLIEYAIENAVLANKNSGREKDIINSLIHYSSFQNNEDTDLGITLAHIRDERGRFPLHYACEHGLPWNDGLENIVLTNYHAVQAVDRETNLLPFMMAASSAHSTRHKRMQYDVTAIYQLLRTYPNII